MTTDDIDRYAGYIFSSALRGSSEEIYLAGSAEAQAWRVYDEAIRKLKAHFEGPVEETVIVREVPTGWEINFSPSGNLSAPVEEREVRQFTETDVVRAFETVEDAAEEIVLVADELVEQCDEYLSTLHCTLWADWSIADPKRRIIAARWLAQQIIGVSVVANDG